MKEKFPFGSLVWAKVKGWRYWPGVVINWEIPSPKRKYQRCVYFFGTNNYSWIKVAFIKRHSEEMLPPCLVNLTKNFQKAVKTLLDVKKKPIDQVMVRGKWTLLELVKDAERKGLPFRKPQIILYKTTDLDEEAKKNGVTIAPLISDESNPCPDSTNPPHPPHCNIPIQNDDKNEEKTDNRSPLKPSSKTLDYHATSMKRVLTQGKKSCSLRKSVSFHEDPMLVIECPSFSDNKDGPVSEEINAGKVDYKSYAGEGEPEPFQPVKEGIQTVLNPFDVSNMEKMEEKSEGEAVSEPFQPVKEDFQTVINPFNVPSMELMEDKSEGEGAPVPLQPKKNEEKTEQYVPDVSSMDVKEDIIEDSPSPQVQPVQESQKEASFQGRNVNEDMVTAILEINFSEKNIDDEAILECFVWTA